MPYSLFPSCDVTRVMPSVSQNSRRAVMQTISKQISSDLNLHAAGVADMLSAQNGTTTSTGDGIVLIDQCLDFIDAPYLLIARLSHPVDFNAADGQLAKGICLLLSPANNKVAHIRNVGRMTRLFHDAEFCAKLHSATSEDAIRALFMVPALDILAA